MPQDVMELMERIEGALKSAYLPERHTYFQLKNFVVGKEPTIQGQLWQVARELRARKETMESMRQQFEEAEDGLELAELRVERLTRWKGNPEDPDLDLLSREHAIELRKAQRQKRRIEESMEVMKRKLKYVLEEATYLVGAFDALSKIEPMKPLDDIPSQKQFWSEKFHEEIKLRILLNKPFDSDLVKSVLVLDDDSPAKKDMLGILSSMQHRLYNDPARDVRPISSISQMEE